MKFFLLQRDRKGRLGTASVEVGGRQSKHRLTSADRRRLFELILRRCCGQGYSPDEHWNVAERFLAGLKDVAAEDKDKIRQMLREYLASGSRQCGT